MVSVEQPDLATLKHIRLLEKYIYFSFGKGARHPLVFSSRREQLKVAEAFVRD